MKTLLKIYSLLLAFLLTAFVGFAQDPNNVRVNPKSYQSEEKINADNDRCYNDTEAQWDHSKHKTLKNTGAGAGAGAVIGKIFGKGGIGAAAGGAAGAYRGHKKSKQDKQEFNEMYASCLREKGYDVEIVDD